jgi:phage/plasmid-associated DNA primase
MLIKRKKKSIHAKFVVAGGSGGRGKGIKREMIEA